MSDAIYISINNCLFGKMFNSQLYSFIPLCYWNEMGISNQQCYNYLLWVDWLFIESFVYFIVTSFFAQNIFTRHKDQFIKLKKEMELWPTTRIINILIGYMGNSNIFASSGFWISPNMSVCQITDSSCWANKYFKACWKTFLGHFLFYYKYKFLVKYSFIVSRQ